MNGSKIKLLGVMAHNFSQHLGVRAGALHTRSRPAKDTLKEKTLSREGRRKREGCGRKETIFL